MSKRRTADQIAAVESWRERWETDRSVTRQMIADECGTTYYGVKKHSINYGWKRGHDVRQAALVFALKCRHTRAKDRHPGVPRAFPSVWKMAAGTAVTTQRVDGKHIEVKA